MNRGMELSEVQEGIRDAETAAKVRRKSSVLFFLHHRHSSSVN